MTENQISEIIIGCAIDVHKAIGPGLLENVYQECLLYELIKKGLKAEKEKPLPVIYKEIKMEVGYRADIMYHGGR